MIAWRRDVKHTCNFKLTRDANLVFISLALWTRKQYDADKDLSKRGTNLRNAVGRRLRHFLNVSTWEPNGRTHRRISTRFSITPNSILKSVLFFVDRVRLGIFSVDLDSHSAIVDCAITYPGWIVCYSARRETEYFDPLRGLLIWSDLHDHDCHSYQWL